MHGHWCYLKPIFHRLPSTHALREYSEVGGLTSYGANISDAYRQAGIYAGRIMKGAKIADLPVVHSSKFELVINADPLGCSASPSHRCCLHAPTR